MKLFKKFFPVTLTLIAVTCFSSEDLESIIKHCDACHGDKGNSKYSQFPSIAGFSEFYLDENMRVYRDAARPCEVIDFPGKSDAKATSMCELAANLSNETIAQIAEFYAKQTFQPIKQEFDAEKAKVGADVHEKHCKRCHSSGGSDPLDDAGILAGQWKTYLSDTFSQYESSKRPQPEKMAEKFNKLDADSKDALLHYYASQQ
ncbi:c-type cytochrome [Pleionea sediminis]|uniref:c-type cytochrome n=1 Tax=Pleionea sediminis TaxID=2569479 RepID=UPI001185A461|nr:sulfide dehydrogenase [Pleionea sediminis]